MLGTLKPGTPSPTQSGTLVGDDAKKYQDLLDVKYPVKSGRIENWFEMEKVWHYIFYSQLRVAPEEWPVLMSEPSLNPKELREKTTQCMFETFNVPAFYLNTTAVLSLYASGRTAGLVMDIGHDVFTAVPVYEGYALPHAINRVSVGGNQVTQYLKQLLSRPGTGSDLSFESIRELKEQHGVCRLFDAPETQSVSAGYKLPDNSKVFVDTELSECYEVLFSPSRVGCEGFGVVRAAYESILKCDVDIRNTLFENVLLAGYPTMAKNFADRFEKQLASEAGKANLKVIARRERALSAWVGGSILASLTTLVRCGLVNKSTMNQVPALCIESVSNSMVCGESIDLVPYLCHL